MLFPTIRFAIFFAVVMPASWLLMPLLGRAGWRGHAQDRGQAWTIPAGLIGAAALLGPLAPNEGWPTGLKVILTLASLVLAGLGVIRWFDLTGLTRWNLFILFASYVFYGSYDWHFVALLIASTVFNEVLAKIIERQDHERIRRAWLILAVALNLSVLGWFKYKGFFTESASSLLGPLGIDFRPPLRAIIPPVGISFFTFQALSYVIDTYRRKLRPVPLLEFAVYLSFFPHLVAGPIVRASEFLPQLRVPRDARRVDSGLAFWLISAGLFKKVVVSSYLASAAVDPVFRIPKNHQTLDTLQGIYGYAIQIYCDFSGYTDMAIGLALLLGFRFPRNFNAPYTAASLQDFWRRWHMTLTRWLRDYLYIPLGGNQRGPNRAMLNLFLTMLIGGLWHGAAWTFIFWGALHGGCLAAERILKDRATRRDAVSAEPDIADGEPVAAQRRALPNLSTASPTTRLWLGRLVTFHIVCLGWVFFRSTSLTNAWAVLARLLHPGTGTELNMMVIATIALFLALQFVPTGAVGKAQAYFSRMPVWQQGLALSFSLVLTNALAPMGVSPFIYFAF